MSDLFLEVLEGPGKGGGYRLLSDTALVGRGADCDIKLENVRGVSRQHCRLYVMDGNLRVQDLNSQNGVIINGKRITDAVVHPGVAIKIGEAVLAVRREDPTIIKSAVARQLDSAELLAEPPANGELAPAPAPAPAPRAENAVGAARPLSNLEEAQELMESAGRSSRGILMGLAVVIAVIFAGLYLVSLVSQYTTASRTFVIVKAGEDKVVDLGALCVAAVCNNTVQGRNIIASPIKEYNGLLADCLKKNRYPAHKMMLIHGSQEGEGWIKILDGNGNQVSQKRVVCRGVKKRVWDEKDLDTPEARARARETAARLAAEGDTLSKDSRHYDAWKKYREASELINAIPNSAVNKELSDADEKLSSDCDQKGFDCQKKLKDTLRKAFDDALGVAFPADLRTAKPNYNDALVRLDHVKTMIPDMESIDRQVIENWQIIIEKERKKARRLRTGKAETESAKGGV